MPIANSRLDSDLGDLPGAAAFNGDLKAYAADWAQMQKDYQQEQLDYQQGCGQNGSNVGVVSYDASNVTYDLSSIHYDDSSLSYDESSMSTPLKHMHDDLQTAQTDWQALQAAVAADPTGTRLTQFSASTVNAKLTDAQQQVDASNKALQSAQTQAKQYDDEAAKTNTDAQNLANSLHC